MDRGALERALADVADFSEPSVRLEQYPTPDWLAAHLLHAAAVRGDLDGTVLDLGAGTGMLALGAALTGRPARVLGLELDAGALAVARAPVPAENASVALRGVRFERDGRAVVAAADNTSVTVARKESYD